MDTSALRPARRCSDQGSLCAQDCGSMAQQPHRASPLLHMHTQLLFVQPSAYSWRPGLSCEIVQSRDMQRSWEPAGPELSSPVEKGWLAVPSAGVEVCTAGHRAGRLAGEEERNRIAGPAGGWPLLLTGLPSWSSHKTYSYIMVLRWLMFLSFHYTTKSFRSGSMSNSSLEFQGLACGPLSCQLDG